MTLLKFLQIYLLVSYHSIRALLVMGRLDFQLIFGKVYDFIKYATYNPSKQLTRYLPQVE